MVDQRAVLLRGPEVHLSHDLAMDSNGRQAQVHQTALLVQFNELRDEVRSNQQAIMGRLSQQEAHGRVGGGAAVAMDLGGGALPGDGLAGLGANRNGEGGHWQAMGCIPGQGASAVAGVLSSSGVGATVRQKFAPLPKLASIKFNNDCGLNHGCQYVARLFLGTGVAGPNGKTNGIGLLPNALREEDRGWKTDGGDAASRLEAVWKMILNVRGTHRVYELNSAEERAATLNAAKKIDAVVADPNKAHQYSKQKSPKHIGQFVALVLKDQTYEGDLKSYVPLVIRRPRPDV